MIFNDTGKVSRTKEAKIGIGFSVPNRIKKHKKNWGYTIHEVILKKYQYDSFWNKNTKDKVKNPLNNNIERSIWDESYKAAEIVLNGQTKDPTSGATYFHSFDKKKNFPRWATKKNFKIKIDAVYFYELKA